jgi:hypothetical protein
VGVALFAREFGWTVEYIMGLDAAQVALLCEGLRVLNGGTPSGDLNKLKALAKEQGLIRE